MTRLPAARYVALRATCEVPTTSQASAEPVAESEPTPPAGPRWVVFGCDGRRFGLPLARVWAISPPLPFTRLPGCGAEVAGLIGLRGRVATVLDLGVILSARPATTLPDHRLLLVDDGERLLGFAVDDVRAVGPAIVRGPTDADDPLAGIEPDNAHTRGAGAIDGMTFLAVDLDSVLGQWLA